MTIVVPTVEELVDPRRAALLLIDIQAHVLHDKNYISGSGDAIENLKRLVAAARRAGVTVANIRGVEKPDTNTPAWVSRHVTKPHRLNARLEGTPGAEFHPDFLPQPGEMVFVKRRYSAFFKTGLEEALRSRGIDSVLLTGIATNICVEITMGDAFQRDFWTIMVADCTASRSIEEQQRAAKDAERNWGLVVNSDRVIAAWQKGRVPAQRVSPSEESRTGERDHPSPAPPIGISRGVSASP